MIVISNPGPQVPPEPIQVIPTPQQITLPVDVNVVPQNPVFPPPFSPIPVPPFAPPPVAPVIEPAHVIPALPPQATEFPGGSETVPSQTSGVQPVFPTIVFPGTTTPTPTVYPAQNVPIPAP
jgi:hypothetical protein